MPEILPTKLPQENNSKNPLEMPSAQSSEGSRTSGVLLINLGTPTAPTVSAVRRYLLEFLSDPRVIDIFFFLRWILLVFFILPWRPRRVSRAYRQVWLGSGSPLAVHSESLRIKLAERLGSEYSVKLAMRYGQPSIERARRAFEREGLDQVLVLPLYPQYASSSTGTALERVYREFGRSWNVLPLKVIRDFYNDAGFIESFLEVGRPLVEAQQPDHVLFSFHGLPERHILKSDPADCENKFCLSSASCCDVIMPKNTTCYRAQCFESARLIAKGLKLSPKSYSVSFQSRLGRTPWIQPFTDVVVVDLARSGVKKLVVFSPSFVADCLETVEEIGLRAHQAFTAAGGQELTLVPSLNGTPRWAQAVADLVEKNL